jgi:hypothetical protein
MPTPWPSRKQIGGRRPHALDKAPPRSQKPSIRNEASGATRRIRTDDLLITNQLLYQLS